MLQGFLRNHKKKLIIIFIMSTILIVGVSIGNQYRNKKLYNKQTVMAKEYLESGDYNQAIESYEIALTMKNGDKESLSVGLAEAYIGNNEYDKALEILRGNYEIGSGNVIKEKIEEVTLKNQTMNMNELFLLEMYTFPMKNTIKLYWSMKMLKR